MAFSSFGLSAPILKAIEQAGYDNPSPIQAKAIPEVLSGKDVMAAAQTGTGKTAAFTLPMLQILTSGQRARSNHLRALILTPTRELAAQIEQNIQTYGQFIELNYAVVFGGVGINPQMMKLRKGVDILVATPGRLLDLYQQNAVKFSQLEILVLDEADRMLDMGFIRDINKIIALLPKQRQNLLFSATFSDDIRALAKTIVHQPVEVSVAPANSTAVTIEQSLYSVDKKKKTPLLIKLIKEHNWTQVLVFARTKHGANRLTRDLCGKNINAAAIHGNKSQGARTKALADFKAGKVQVLVATDIAARGIDIAQLPQVVNFELPHVSEDYVHRIGRTGRAGQNGCAVSLVAADEFKQLLGIERLTQQVLPRLIDDEFSPANELPPSPTPKPFKTKKPKKPKQTKAVVEKVEHQDGQRSGDNKRGHKPVGKNKRHLGNKSRTPSPSHSRNSEASRDGKPRRHSNNKPRRISQN